MKSKKMITLLGLSLVGAISCQAVEMPIENVEHPMKYPAPQMSDESKNRLLLESLKENENLRVDGKRSFIVEDSMTDDAVKVFTLSDLVSQFEKKINSLTSKSFIFIPQSEKLEVNLSNNEYLKLMSANNIHEFSKTLTEITKFNISNYVSFSNESEEIVYVGNDIAGMNTNSIVLKTPTRAFRYLKRSYPNEFRKAEVKLSEDEWFDFMKQINSDSSLSHDRRVEGIQAIRRFFMSQGSEVAKKYVPLLKDNATQEDLNIAFLYKYNKAGDIGLIFSSYLYLIKNDILRNEIKEILDDRIIEHTSMLNAKKEHINMGLLYEALSNPTYRMINELWIATNSVQTEQGLKVDPKQKELAKLKQEEEALLASTTVNGEALDQELEERDESNKSWWKFWQ